ncbi:hypothetical protein LguiB_032652 [Lonicera macranthoides]
MSSKYPNLDNKPIDQWKVTELKEELRRRKLPVKGLKDDLIKRLDEALRAESESAKDSVDNGLDCDQHAVQSEDGSTAPNAALKTRDIIEESDNKNEETENTRDIIYESDNKIAESETRVIINESHNKNEETGKTRDTIGESDSKSEETETTRSVVEESENKNEVTETMGNIIDERNDKNEETGDAIVESGEKIELVDNDKIQVDKDDGLGSLGKEFISGNDSTGVEEERGFMVQETTVETTVTVTESVATEIVLSGPEFQNSETQNLQLVNEEDSRPPQEEAKFDSSDFNNNQVFEVSQVKSDSISTDTTVSINEKNELLKDNVIADDVKLELDDVKPEIAQPLSSDNIIVDSVKLQAMDVDELKGNKVTSEGTGGNDAESADIGKKNDSGDVGSAEKLNLDRSSGDDSMEEDVLESKEIDLKFNSDDVCEKNEVPVVKEEGAVGVIVEDLPDDKKSVNANDKSGPAGPDVKRKFDGQETAVNNESTKRQRRWNTEGLKVIEPQSINISPSTTTPKDAFQPIGKRSFSRSDSMASVEAPKERVVPPSSKPSTNSLRIDRFLRPFTLKAVQELLGKTGSVTSFWMDHIKTHCYVTYSSVEEAVETRNAVYNLQWPPNGGRLLVAEFVDPQEVKTRVEGPPPSPAPPATTAPPTFPPPAAATATKKPSPAPSPRLQVQRQQLPPPPSLPPPPPLSNPPPIRERPLPPPPPLPLPEKVDPPIVTLDDLFRKTKATPRIYYLPLSDEEVAAKAKAQGKTAMH